MSLGLTKKKLSKTGYDSVLAVNGVVSDLSALILKQNEKVL